MKIDQRPEDRDGFRFRGGSPSLDLTATLQGRLKPAPRELLAAPQDLDRWLVSAGLAETAPGATLEDVETARALREAVHAIAGRPDALDPGACQALNRIAAGAPATPELRADGRVALKGSAGALLCALARDAIGLFGGQDAARIRKCESPSCAIFFVDASHSGRRRWCSMAACGNKAKVAALRRRARGIEVEG